MSTLATLAYLVYLLRAAAHAGRPSVVVSGWALLSRRLLVAAGRRCSNRCLLQAALIWLVRSLYFHASLLAALLDFGLVAVGLPPAPGRHAQHRQPGRGAVEFFLLQALFCWIPEPRATSRQNDEPARRRRFARPASNRAPHRLDAVRKFNSTHDHTRAPMKTQLSTRKIVALALIVATAGGIALFPAVGKNAGRHYPANTSTRPSIDVSRSIASRSCSSSTPPAA